MVGIFYFWIKKMYKNSKKTYISENTSEIKNGCTIFVTVLDRGGSGHQNVRLLEVLSVFITMEFL